MYHTYLLRPLMGAEVERQFCCFTTHVSTCELVVRYRAPPDRHSITAKMARWRRDRVSQSDIIFDGSRNTPLARPPGLPHSFSDDEEEE